MCLFVLLFDHALAEDSTAIPSLSILLLFFFFDKCSP